MFERRRSIRKPFSGSIAVDEIYNQNGILKDTYVVDVEFFDISREGLGFFCTEKFPMEYYFNAKIDLGNETSFYAVIKIIRCIEHRDGYRYGCIFVGLADILALLIDEYNTGDEHSN